MEPHNPQHPPMVMVTWQAEGNAGKKTIIVDFKSEEGKKVAFDFSTIAKSAFLQPGAFITWPFTLFFPLQ